MSTARAAARRAARAAAHRRQYPLVPGVLRDGSQEAIADAMLEAHEVLPNIPGTQVQILTNPDRAEGLHSIRLAFGDEGVAAIEQKLAELGPDAMITIALRSDPALRTATDHNREHGSDCACGGHQ